MIIRNNIYDFGNTNIDDFNKSGITTIKSVVGIYLKDVILENCCKCVGPIYNGWITTSPPCLITCPFKKHKTGGTKDKPSKHFTLDLKSPYNGLRFNISRAHFFWNLYMDFSFIFRFGSDSGIVLHHNNMNELDDSKENLTPTLAGNHSSYHAILKNYKILKLLSEHTSEQIEIINRYEEILNKGVIPCWDRVYTIVEMAEKSIKRGVVLRLPEEWGINLGAKKDNGWAKKKKGEIICG